MINCPNEIEPDVLHTVCATRVQKLKIELRMYGVIGGSTTRAFCRSVSPRILHPKSQKVLYWVCVWHDAFSAQNVNEGKCKQDYPYTNDCPVFTRNKREMTFFNWKSGGSKTYHCRAMPGFQEHLIVQRFPLRVTTSSLSKVSEAWGQMVRKTLCKFLSAS